MTLRFWSLVTIAGLATVSASAGFAQVPSTATSPQTTTPATTPACAVSGPRLDDRRAALRTGLPEKQTIIALDLAQRKALPDEPVPPRVRARLKEVGAFFGPIDDDGTISIKSMWRKDLRRATGVLRVSGKRLDGPSGRFFADLSPRYANRRTANFVPGSLNFTTAGCWQIEARAGKARVTYVALVRLPEPGEFAPYFP